MSKRGFGFQLMEAIGICTLIVIFGPYMSKFYLFYLIIMFGVVVLCFAMSKKKNSKKHKKSNGNNQIIRKNKASSEDLCYGNNNTTLQESKFCHKNTTEKQYDTNDCLPTKILKQMAQRTTNTTANCAKKISRKMNCIASSRVFRTARLDQTRTPKKQYSVEFHSSAKDRLDASRE